MSMMIHMLASLTVHQDACWQPYTTFDLTRGSDTAVCRVGQKRYRVVQARHQADHGPICVIIHHFLHILGMQAGVKG